jgi:hypothetical protein
MILLLLAASCLSSFAVMSAQEDLRDPDLSQSKNARLVVVVPKTLTTTNREKA